MKRWFQEHGHDFAAHVLLPLIFGGILVVGVYRMTKAVSEHEQRYMQAIKDAYSAQDSTVPNR